MSSWIPASSFFAASNLSGDCARAGAAKTKSNITTQGQTSFSSHHLSVGLAGRVAVLVWGGCRGRRLGCGRRGRAAGHSRLSGKLVGAAKAEFGEDVEDRAAAAGDEEPGHDPADEIARRLGRTRAGEGVDDMLEDVDVVTPQQRNRRGDGDRGLDPLSVAMLGEEAPVEDRRQRRLEHDRDDEQKGQNIADLIPIHVQATHLSFPLRSWRLRSPVDFEARQAVGFHSVHFTLYFTYRQEVRRGLT